MKRVLLLVSVLLIISCTPLPKAVWIEGEKHPDKHAVHEFVITGLPDGLDWDIWGVFDRIWTMPLVVTEDSDADMEVFDGTCVRITPRVEKDTLHIRYDNRYLNKKCRAPRGLTLKFRHSRKSMPIPLEYVFQPSPELEEDSYVHTKTNVWDMVPELKEVDVLGGSTELGDIRYQFVEGKREGWYRITVDGSCVVEYSDASGKDYAKITLDRIVGNNSGNREIPNMIIEDWPDFKTRPFMLDVARLFLPKENVFELIDLMYRAKMNTLFIHLTDDEGWRLEIRGLEELTSFGAFHEIPEYGSDGFYVGNGLFPAQNGAVGRKKPWISANGYYSRRDYIDILKYAAQRHISVIPELDIPGHSGSAVESMRYRARTTGDESYLLTDPGDTSRFMAYLGFVDNTVDPGLESTYKFIGHVFDDLKSIYEEAGLVLETINISGDEVAEGVWTGSPAAQRLMKENGWSSTGELWSYFLGRVLDMLSERNLKFAGYTEVVVGTDDKTLEKMRENASFLIIWRPLGRPAELDKIPYYLANNGFKVLLSHSDHTYMDNAYYKHRDEPGLDWGGTTTERYAYNYNPLHLFDGPQADENPLLCPENIAGVMPMLWGDNVYSYEQACYLLFPKIYGLFDRCWNAVPGEDFNHFYSIVVNQELPYLDSRKINHRRSMQVR